MSRSESELARRVAAAWSLKVFESPQYLAPNGVPADEMKRATFIMIHAGCAEANFYSINPKNTVRVSVRVRPTLKFHISGALTLRDTLRKFFFIKILKMF